MKNKILKILILFAFVALFITMAIWMFNRYTLQSPYYEQTERSD